MKYTKRQRGTRLGAATVELAFCLPILLLIAWSTVELNTSIFLKQTLTAAAHEGVLVALRRGATEQDILDRIDFILSARDVQQYTAVIETNSGGYDSIASGEPFTVSITADPHTENYFVNLVSLEARLTAYKP